MELRAKQLPAYVQLGRDRSIERIDEAGSADELAIAVNEALMWIGTCRDGARQGDNPLDEPLVNGLWWARNRAVHDASILPRLIEVPGTLGVTMLGVGMFGASVSVIRWADPKDLPEGQNNGKAEYAEHVAGEPVSSTLREARRLLDQELEFVD